MTRLASLLLFVGGVLLLSWAVAPAAPPVPPPVSAQDLAALRQSGPILAQVNAEVERLRDRLASRPAAPTVVRDPFSFGKRPAPPAPRPIDATAASAVPPIATTPALPRLVAITSEKHGTDVLFSAVLSFGDDVLVVKPGGTISAFIVRSIGADGVELLDPISGATFRISLQ
jgi:hypothetical protein